jgi:hypothetical protein
VIGVKLHSCHRDALRRATCNETSAGFAKSGDEPLQDYEAAFIPLFVRRCDWIA